MALDTCQGGEVAAADCGRDTLSIARTWLDQYPAIAVATVMQTWGSAPVPVGGQLLIAPGERVEGSVSGGCVEASVIEDARAVIETGVPKVLGFGVEDKMAWRAGLPCGGRIEVLVARYSGEADRVMLDDMLKARAERRLVVLETHLATGARVLHTSLEAFEGGVQAKLSRAECVIWGETPGAFLHVHAPETQLVIVGAGHIGQMLSELASRIGYKVTVIDPRGVYAAAERFRVPGIDIKQEWPESAFAGLALDERSAVMTLSHVAEIDDEALLIALRSRAFYVGALGSRTSHAARVARLRAKGLGEDQIARLDAPAGLPIGAVGPQEIAVSMLGAIIKAARSAS